MSSFETVAALLSLAAAFAYVNQRWIRLPASIALMAMTLAVSLVLLALGKARWLDLQPLAAALHRVPLEQTLLHGMLGALLFAGALHVRIDDLRAHKLAVSFLSVAATLLSTAIVGGLSFFLLRAVGAPLDAGACALFGAVVSPTDPIAVLGILRHARVPRAMEVQIAGESLFNDGVGVVVFTSVLAFVGHGGATAGAMVLLFFREAVGGVVFGLASGYLVFRLLRRVDHYQTELLLTIALVVGGYALAERLGVSAPIGAVVAGLVIGNYGRAHGMSELTRDTLDKFWSVIDDILNALLFVLMGLEVVRLPLSRHTVVAGALAVPLVLVGRWASVAAPIGLLARRARFARGTITVLTWGGLRGGISIALALSTPEQPAKNLIVTMTYFVVTFSILVQGLTLGRVARRFSPAATPG